jgi:hypothetical protein
MGFRAVKGHQVSLDFHTSPSGELQRAAQTLNRRKIIAQVIEIPREFTESTMPKKLPKDQYYQRVTAALYKPALLGESDMSKFFLSGIFPSI